MSIEPGSYALGPEDGTLSVRTGRSGAAAKAGHNLLIEVSAWSATVEVDADPAQTRMQLSADARSLRVREGTGGIQKLGDDDKDGIAQTIDEEVLKGTEIQFRSSAVDASPDDGRLTVRGELQLAGKTKPISFELGVLDGRLTGSAVLKQSEWGMKLYSALFGTLKVADEVRVEIDAGLSTA
jgi:polyisoprenoid-binding protein YceI